MANNDVGHIRECEDSPNILVGLNENRMLTKSIASFDDTIVMQALRAFLRLHWLSFMTIEMILNRK